MNTAESTLLHGITPDGLRDLISQETNRLLVYNPDKFYNVLVSGEHFCLIHSISRVTLQRWIKLGIVNPEFRDDEKDHYRFRLSDVLKFDVDSIKRKRNKQLILLNAESRKKRK
jgi:hypothetical protein